MKTAPIPERVRVFGNWVRVLVVDPSTLDGDRGASCPQTLTIWVSSDETPAQRRVVLWHEIRHLINWELDIGDESTEEESVERGAFGEVAVLRDNPELVAFLSCEN